MSILLNFAMFPTDKGVSKSESVSKVIKFIKSTGVEYKLNPMGTTIETDTMEEALEIVNKAYQVLKDKHKRVYTTITIDAREGESDRMKTKIASIENKIGTVKQ